VVPEALKESSKLKSTLSYIFLRTRANSSLSKIEPKMSNMYSEVKSDRLSSKISSIIKSRNEAQEKLNPGEMEKRVLSGVDDDSMEVTFSKSDEDLIYNQTNEPFDQLKGGVYKSSEVEASKVAMTKAVIKYPLQKRAVPSKKAEEDSQPALKFEDTVGTYELPPLNVLTNPVVIERQQMSDEALEENARGCP